jgi:hypothetical protein
MIFAAFLDMLSSGYFWIGVFVGAVLVPSVFVFGCLPLMGR